MDDGSDDSDEVVEINLLYAYSPPPPVVPKPVVAKVEKKEAAVKKGTVI